MQHAGNYQCEEYNESMMLTALSVVYEIVIYIRNIVLSSLYKYIVKPIFFKIDPETIHDYMISFGQIVCLPKIKYLRFVIGIFFNYTNKRLHTTIRDHQGKVLLHLNNPLGLSAGFDKNGDLTALMGYVGFGFGEVGSVTGFPCAGNAKPRLWRLPKSKSLLVYYGLKSDGANITSERVKKNRAHTTTPKYVVGANVAMTNCLANTDVETGVVDFVQAFTMMEPAVDYMTVNVSCPNTVGGQPFMNPVHMDTLLTRIDAIPCNKPVFVKLSPDVSDTELDVILDILKKHRVHGIICTNLTKKRDLPQIQDSIPADVGGMSGKVVAHLADHMIEYIYKREKNRFIIVGCGGIFTAEDAYKKIRKGATMLEMITGMIYGGPNTMSIINQGLVRLLKRDGFNGVTEAVGVDCGIETHSRV